MGHRHSGTPIRILLLCAYYTMRLRGCGLLQSVLEEDIESQANLKALSPLTQKLSHPPDPILWQPCSGFLEATPQVRRPQTTQLVQAVESQPSTALLGSSSEGNRWRLGQYLEEGLSQFSLFFQNHCLRLRAPSSRYLNSSPLPMLLLFCYCGKQKVTMFCSVSMFY